MSAPTPKIRIRGLHKSFDENVVLDGLDLDVGVGESVVVIGGSGTGKSVLLKCVLGLLRPESGSIEVNVTSCKTLIFSDAYNLLFYNRIMCRCSILSSFFTKTRLLLNRH